MSRNWDDLTPARRYHERTKHSFESVRLSGHRLDWANRPSPFKEYRGIEPEPIPESLERLLRWGAGVVRTRDVGGGDVYHFRTYASAGALYPIEVYVADARGIYHFHPRELAVRRLREGDYRAALVEDAEAVLVLTGILWRTAWKYQARGYRHLYWDAGTMLANLIALADRPRLVTGFVDADVNELVGVDGEREAALALLAVGSGEPPAETPPLAPLDLDVPPLSAREVEYPEASELHAASALTSADEVRRYTDALKPTDVPSLADEPLEPVLRRRGSARTFTHDPIPLADLTDMLVRTGGGSTDLYLIANAVDGLDAGAYRFEAPDRFKPIKQGNFRAHAAYLTLEQAHGGNAAATHFVMADLDEMLATLGNRGYREAQLEAGMRAGRIYVGAYARGYGATGLTFYDDDVSRFFETTLAPMLCVAAGPYARRR